MSDEVPCDVKARRWMRRCYLLRQEQAWRRFGEEFFRQVESERDFEITLPDFSEQERELRFEAAAS